MDTHTTSATPTGPLSLAHARTHTRTHPHTRGLCREWNKTLQFIHDQPVKRYIARSKPAGGKEQTGSGDGGDTMEQ